MRRPKVILSINDKHTDLSIVMITYDNKHNNKRIIKIIRECKIGLGGQVKKTNNYDVICIYLHEIYLQCNVTSHR